MSNYFLSKSVRGRAHVEDMTDGRVHPCRESRRRVFRTRRIAYLCQLLDYLNSESLVKMSSLSRRLMLSASPPPTCTSINYDKHPYVCSNVEGHLVSMKVEGDFAKGTKAWGLPLDEP